MKNMLLLLAALLVLCASCATTKNSNDKWIGESKQNFIKVWGPPIRTLELANNGEMLIYGEQVYANANNEEGSRVAGPNYWNYIYVYTNKEGKIYSCKTEKQQITPQEIAVK